MKLLEWIWGVLTWPFRFIGGCVNTVVAMNRRQIRAIATLFILCGIVSLSIENWILTYAAYHAVEEHNTSEASPFFKLILERVRYNSGLQAWFSIIIGLIVFGAEYFHAKILGHEIKAGKGKDEDEEDLTPGN